MIKILNNKKIYQKNKLFKNLKTSGIYKNISISN